MSTAVEWLTPDWPAPARVHAASTLRVGGVSLAPYDSLNLGNHVDDDPAAVAENRRRLAEALNLPGEPRWLEQVHGTIACAAEGVTGRCDADASFTAETGVVCVVMTADCLPLLFCNREGTRVAAVHAGWRGLQAGVIEQTVGALGVDGGELLVWLGPAIGPDAFEVGNEVRGAFVGDDAVAAEAFRPSLQGRWLANLYRLARQRLNGAGVTAIYGGDRCTYSEADHFFSYRRDGITGRQATLIWLG